MTRDEPDATKLLTDYVAGVSGTDRIFPLIYEELKSIARRHLRHAPGDGMLQPTALVHEVYLRLIDQTRINANDRRHFLAIAAGTLRRVLVDHVRASQVAKRGGRWGRVSLRSDLVAEGSRPIDFIALDEALAKLQQINQRRAQIVELRFFGGFSIEETAELLAVSPRTVKDDWTVARAFLFRELKGRSR